MYVLRYEVFDDLISFPDVADTRPDRSLWPTTSPIALFAVKDKRLRPVAIQIDYKPGLKSLSQIFLFFYKLAIYPTKVI